MHVHGHEHGTVSTLRELRDQLDRASTSIVLNIAEGAGRRGAADRARLFAMARGSATECAAILDILDGLQ